MKHLLQIEEPWYRLRSLFIHHFNLQLYCFYQVISHLFVYKQMS